MSLRAEKPVVFGCAGEQLIGVLHVPEASIDVGVVVVVGGPQYRVGSHRQFVHLARALATEGFPVMRFDCRGMGDSSGAFPGFEALDPDVRAAIDAMTRELPDISRIVLFGLCDAASAALLYCTTDARVSGLVLANPWVRTPAGEAASFVKHYYGRRVLERAFWTKLLTGRLDVLAALVDFLKKLMRGLTGARADAVSSAVPFVARMLHGLESFRGPVLVLVSEQDLTAQEFRDLCKSSPRWRAALGKPAVSVEEFAGADHTFSSGAARDRMNAVVLAWLSRGRSWQTRIAAAAVPTDTAAVGLR
jgi:uncharacterized protein